MRAGNKNRSLRPRTSATRNSAVPPESDLATSEKDEAASSQAVTADPTTLEAVRAAKPAASTPEVAEPTKITPAEVLAAGEAFSARDDDDDEDEDDEAPAAKVAAAPAKVEAPVVAKKVEEPKKAEPVVVKKAEEPKKVEPIVAKKTEAPVAAKKFEEPKKSEPAPSKKGEPVKVAEAKRVEENATTIRSERIPSADGDQRSGNNNKKKGSKNDGPKVEAKRSGTDEVDDSSISAEFFRREGDSLPPMVDAHGDHDDHDEAGGVHVLSPATIARRARLRRVVAGVVAFAGVITLAVVGKTLAASKTPATSVPMKPPVVQEAKVEEKPEVKAPPPVEVKAPPAPEKSAEAVAVPAPTTSASAEVAKVEPDPKAEVKPVEDPKKVEAGGGDAKALTKEAESFLNRGNRKEAMAKAREAITADPSQALPYLLLGSALQDSGKWKDGIEAYSECVRNATKGPVGDCRQMGGHK